MAIAVTKNPSLALTIKQWRESTDRTRLSLSKELNVSKNSVANWESGQNQPTVAMLQTLADLAEAPFREFFLQQAKAKSGLTFDAIGVINAMGVAVVRKRKAARENATPGDLVEVPLVEVEAAAGLGHLQDGEHIVGLLMLPKEDIPNPSETKIIRVKGESMLPTIAPQALAAIDGSQCNIERLIGKIVAAYHETDGLVIKRLVKVEGKHRLASDSPGYIPFEVANGWRIVGRLVWWMQSE